MMIKCDQHGFQPGVQLSPDLETAVKSARHIHDIIVLKYEYLEEIVDVFYFSRSYANQYGVSENITMPLSDDYPDYVKSTLIVCKQCFIEYIADESVVL